MTIETAPTLLERKRELEVLEHGLAEAHRHRGQVVLIEASGGLGKTSLLSAAADAAAAGGFACYRARATEFERDFAYGCVRQLLEPAVAQVSDAESGHLFAGAAALAKPLFAPTSDRLSPPSPDSAFAMLHGLYWLLGNLAAQNPVALLLDDLNWSDVETLRFLVYLAPRLDGLPVCVVATKRPGEGHAAELAGLAIAPETTVVRPQPLSIEATATVCELRLGPDVSPEFAAACRRVTGGNPFFLEALLGEVGERGTRPDGDGAASVRGIGPPAVAQAVLLRLSRKPAAARALVRAVAVLGERASLAEAALLAGLGEPEAAAAADLLVGVAIFKRAERLDFAHPILREAVYADMPPRERLEAHASAAEILAAGSAGDERVAAQIVEAEPAGDATRVELLRRVAADALVRGAPAAAAAWLGRALAEPPPGTSLGEVLLELSLAKLRLGAPETAVDQLAAATELVRTPELLARSARLLGGALTWSGDADRAVEAIGSAIEALEPDDRELALLLEADRAAYAQQGSLAARAPAARRLEQHAGLEGATPGERLVLASLAFERARASESATEAAGCIETALAGGGLLGEQELDVAGTLYLLAVGLLATDALDLADECLDAMLSDAEARASIPAQAFVIVHRGWVSLRRGAVARAEADARTALELLTTYDIRLGTRFALGLLIEALIEAGRVPDAEQALEDSEYGDEIPPGMASNALLEARALLRLAQGKTREGLDDLLAFGRHDELWGAANPLASRWRSHASLALAAIGDGERASAMAGEDLARARRWGAASGVGSALRAVALAEGGPAGIDRLREAAEVLERSPARLDHARALTDLGAALRRANRRAEARGALEKGLRAAEGLGAYALADRARTELRAAGGQTSDPFASGVEQLTASERRVAELAAEGRSNPEIAQTLFVTRKTVETHLGRVYRKLDLSGRGELEGALREPAGAD